MVAFKSLPRPVRSLRHQVVQMLREAIITGQIKPGERLLEEEISQQMEISRGPVREALRQLEQEGLVVSYSHRKTEVVGVSAEEVREILIPIRLTLERFAFQHALRRMTKVDFVKLEQLVTQMRQAGERGDLDKAVEADVQFHKLVLEQSNQPHCLQIWHNIEPRVRAYFYRCGPQHHSLIEIAEEHQELLEAMLTGDVKQMLNVLEKHIRDTVLRILGQAASEQSP